MKSRHPTFINNIIDIKDFNYLNEVIETIKGQNDIDINKGFISPFTIHFCITYASQSI